MKVFRLSQRLHDFADLFKQIQPHLRTTYAVLVIATTTSIMFRLTIQSMLPLYAGSHLGFTPTEVGLLFSISGAFVFAMIIPAGFILDKLGRKWATVPSTGLPALAFLLIPFSDTFLELAVIVSLTGIANGLSLGSLATSTYDVVPPAARGRLQAARRMVAEIGGMSGPLIGGLLADAFNPGVPFLVYAPLMLSSAVLLAMVARETLIK
jgi:MFS family permease